VLIAISTSGNSENVIRGIDSAKSLSMKVIVLTGKSGGKMAEYGDVTICIPSDDTQRIQEGHLLAEHILCESVEAGIMGS
jgi:D-sedoheptulose 7-phosphate isomerase